MWVTDTKQGFVVWVEPAHKYLNMAGSAYSTVECLRKGIKVLGCIVYTAHGKSFTCYIIGNVSVTDRGMVSEIHKLLNLCLSQLPQQLQNAIFLLFKQVKTYLRSFNQERCA